MKILDISHWQSKIDFNKVVDLCILKCTESLSYLDPTFKERRDILRKKGLYLGCYHFINLGKNPEQEALWYLKNVGEIKEGELLALDYELKLSNPVPICKQWLDTIYKETGKRAYIYLNESTTNKFDWSPISKEHKLWIAKYSNQ
jgi:lysozyme